MFGKDWNEKEIADELAVGNILTFLNNDTLRNSLDRKQRILMIRAVKAHVLHQMYAVLVDSNMNVDVEDTDENDLTF